MGPQYFNRFVPSLSPASCFLLPASCFLPPAPQTHNAQDLSRDPGRRAEQPVSRVLYGAEAPWQSFLWERSHLRPRAAYPRRLCRRGLLLAAYLALLRRGLPCRLRCRKARWALTPPFHPYHDLLWRSVFCGTIRHDENAVPRGYLAPCPWSPDFPQDIRRSERPATTRLPTAPI